MFDIATAREMEKAEITDRVKVVVTGTKSVPVERYHEEAEDHDPRRSPGRLRWHQVPPRRPREEDRSERSNASRNRVERPQPTSDRDISSPGSPLAVPRTLASKHSTKNSQHSTKPFVPSDDRADGIYTYDYSTGDSQTRHYPLLPEDDMAYGVPNQRRVLAVMKEKQMSEDGEKRTGEGNEDGRLRRRIR